jgi:hypothetical protein
MKYTCKCKIKIEIFSLKLWLGRVTDPSWKLIWDWNSFFDMIISLDMFSLVKITIGILAIIEL